MTTARAKSLHPLFPTLRPGRRRSAEDGDAVASDQRQRLRGAMIAGVARFGYPSLTIDDVCALAGVSTRDFYAHFSSRVDCFLAASEEVFERFCERVLATTRREQGVAAKGIGTIAVLAATIEAEPEAIALVLIDSLTIGRAALEPRRRVQLRLEEIAAGGFAAEGAAISPLCVRSIVFGLRRISQLTILDGDVDRLRAAGPALVRWAIACSEPAAVDPPEVDRRRPGAEGSPQEPGWAEPPSSADSLARLSPGERVLRAVTQLAAEQGYGAVAVPQISARAGTSNEALYKNFGGKEEALFAAFDLLADEMIERVAGSCASRPAGPERTAAGLDELMGQIDQQPLFAGLAHQQLPAVGRVGLARFDRFLSRLGAALLPRASDRPEDQLVAEAALGGLWGTMLSAELRAPDSDPRDLYPELFNVLLRSSQVLDADWCS